MKNVESIEQKILVNLWNKSKKHHFGRGRCYISDCNCKAINSHTYQKNGLLKKLSNDDSCVYITNINEQNPFEYNKNELIENYLIKTKISDASTFYGFCEKHDRELFLPIENEFIEISEKEYIFLNAYRSFAYTHNLEKNNRF